MIIIMDNPVKIIYKYKNVKRHIQYQVYIFVGNLVDSLIIKIFNKVQDLNLYDTLIILTSKELQLITSTYGEYWYRKIFISHHIISTVDNINNNKQLKKNIIDKYGIDWYNKHLSNLTFIDKAPYNYQSIIKSELEFKNRFKNYDHDTDIINNYTIQYNKDSDNNKNIINGGNFDDLESDSDEIEKTIPLDEEQHETDEDDVDNEELDKILRQDETQIDINVKEITEEISLIVDKTEKIIAFDTSKDNNVYDDVLKNIYSKNFIYSQYIYLDDTIKKIKYKICASIEISKNFNKKSPYCIPSRCYLWSEYDYLEPGKNIKKHEKLMLGQKWIIRSELLKIDIEPNQNLHIYENIKSELRYLKEQVNKYGSRIKWQNDENYILDEYADYINNNEIYMVDIYNELGVNYTADAEQIRNLYDVYIKIYFHDISIDDFMQIKEYINTNDSTSKNNESNKIQSIYQNINNELQLENEVMKIVDELKLTKQLYENYYKNNYVTQTDIILNLNFISKMHYNKLDLYRIFDNFIVNDFCPFIQYQNIDGKLVFKLYSPNEEIKNTMVSKWFENSPYGISFKVKVAIKGNESFRYMAINLNENGRIEYKTQWKEDDLVELSDIKRTYNIINELIEKINSENDKLQIILPSDNQYKYAFINTIQQFVLPGTFIINHNDLSDFARYFFPYISIVVEPRKRQSKEKTITDKSKYGTYLRYKRISSYENETRIDNRIIHFLRNYEYIPNILSEEIAKQFNITEKQALDKIEFVRNKYPVLKKTRKILKKLSNLPKYKPPGIGIDIQGKTRDNYKIRISGARSKDQLDRISNFIYILIYLYVDTYLVKNKSRQILKEKLQALTNIAKRRNMVEQIVKQTEEINNIKQITKLDKNRVGFKPEKGQNQWSRSCQNSGLTNRRPFPYTEENIDNLIKAGYILNKKTGYYEKTIKSSKNKKETIIRAAKLDNIYWTCDPQSNKDFMYVGFLSRSNNPSGLSMPCCFKKDPLYSKNKEKRDFYLKTIGKLVSETTDFKNIDKLYILQDTNKMQPNRFGYLPTQLDKYLNLTLKNSMKIKNNYLVSSSGYFLKFGTENTLNTSYINAISSALTIPIDTIKTKIINLLSKEDNYALQIFNSLNNGNIRNQFTTLKNYISFINNITDVDYSLLDDLISIPGVLIPEGLNIYIFNFVNKEYYLLCKNYENLVYFTDTKRKNILLIQEIKNYYPIYFVKKSDTKKEFIIDRTFTFDKQIISILWEYFKINCSQINITNIVLPTVKLALLQLNLKIKMQIIDNKYRCKYLVLENNLLLPINASGTISDIPISDSYNKYLLSLDDTLDKLKRFNSSQQIYDYTPKKLIYNDSTISAILINNNIFIPVIKQPVSTKKYDIDFVLQSIDEEIDYEIKNKIINYDNRLISVNDDTYNSESYELFRLELSYYLENNKNINV